MPEDIDVRSGGTNFLSTEKSLSLAADETVVANERIAVR